MGCPADAGRLDVAALDVDALVRTPVPVPSRGWRAAVFRGSLGRINPGQGIDEEQRVRRRARIAASTDRQHRIAVVSLKGGVGRTTVAAGLGWALADARGDRVVAVDAVPDPGTLADRLTGHHRTGIRTLLADADRIVSVNDAARHLSLAGRLSVLASEQDPAGTDELGAGAYRRATSVLGRFFNVIVTDTAPGLAHPSTRAALDDADMVVVVAGPARDGLDRAVGLMDWMHAQACPGTAHGAVAVIVDQGHGVAADDTVAAELRRRCAAVLWAPFDPELIAGGRMDVDALSAATRDVFDELAATLVDGAVGSAPSGAGPATGGGRW